jgi:hypothetical protein
MGPLRTERTIRALADDPERYEEFSFVMESPEFTGKVIHALYGDPNRMTQSGQVLIGAEVALTYGIVDLEGQQPPSYRDRLGGPVQAHPAIIE